MCYEILIGIFSRRGVLMRNSFLVTCGYITVVFQPHYVISVFICAVLPSARDFLRLTGARGVSRHLSMRFRAAKNDLIT